MFPMLVYKPKVQSDFYRLYFLVRIIIESITHNPGHGWFGCIYGLHGLQTD